MTVLPSTWRIDLKRLRDVPEVRDIRSAREAERESAARLPSGTMPPFRSLMAWKRRGSVRPETSPSRSKRQRTSARSSSRYKDFSALFAEFAAFHHEPSKIESQLSCLCWGLQTRNHFLVRRMPSQRTALILFRRLVMGTGF